MEISEVRGFRFSVFMIDASAIIEKHNELSLWIMCALWFALEVTVSLKPIRSVVSTFSVVLSPCLRQHKFCCWFKMS
jgi:hypothetical protein